MPSSSSPMLAAQLEELDELADSVEDETVLATAAVTSPAPPRRELRRRCSEESLQRASRCVAAACPLFPRLACWLVAALA